MNRSTPPSSKPRVQLESVLCTNSEYVVIEITREVRRFIDAVDGYVEDLSYNIEGIIKAYNHYRHRKTNIRDLDDLVPELLHSSFVKNVEDAEKIASIALYTFYPDIAAAIVAHGYSAGLIHMVKVHTTRDTRMSSCVLLLKVI